MSRTNLDVDAVGAPYDERTPSVVLVMPGDVLPNGATVIECMGDIVLAMWSKGYKTEYVTWKIDLETRECFWGHYYESIRSAVEDYSGRT